MNRVLKTVFCIILAALTAGCSAQTGLELPMQSPAQVQTEEAVITTSQTTAAPTPEPLSYEQERDAFIAQLMENMTTDEKIGQLIMTDIFSAQADKTSAYYMADIQPGGVSFGRQNFVTIDQTLKLVDDLNAMSRIPLIISCTQEGGRVTRTTYADIPATLLPPMYDIGRTGDTTLAYRAGQMMASELLSLGVNLDFAPVADVWNNPDNTVIGDRSFGSSPQLVADMVSAMVRGMNEQGIGTTLKHFPGHGGTAEDSHLEATYCYSTLEELYECELVPFIAGIEAGADAVMTAHVIYPNITDSGEPATVSHFFLTELLREQLGFEGLIVTDSMHMLGMMDYMDIPTACEKAIEAGADVLLVTREYIYEVFYRLKGAVSDGDITQERLDESVRRILLFKYEHHLFDESYKLPDPYQTIGTQQNKDLVEQIVSLLPEAEDE